VVCFVQQYEGSSLNYTEERQVVLSEVEPADGGGKVELTFRRIRG
jgi:hypothetical protein